MKVKELNNRRKVILYIAMSLDGYIAKPNDDLSFLSMVEKEGEDYGYAAFVASIDTVIVGRKTYDWVCANMDGFHHSDKESYIMTRTSRPNIGNLTFYTKSPSELLEQIRTKEGKNIFVDGGAETATLFMKADLVDEYIISIIPILLGEGTRLFKDNRPEQTLELITTKHFDKGLVQVHYKRKRD